MLGGFTIQLASLPRDDNVTRYVKNAAHLVDSAMVFVQPSVYNGREYISVFYGKFDSMAAAQRAVAQLPEALKTNKPVVRTWIKIKEDQLP
jgi:septal ring-binding cell division protein DamX